MFQVWRGLPGLKARADANTWLYRVALNTSISFHRKRAARAAAETANYDQSQIDRVLDTQPSFQAQGEQLTDLCEAILKLNDLEKALITLETDQE